MAQATPTAPRLQFDALRNQLAKQERLPFLKILSRTLVEQVCRHCNHRWRERIYTPWITLGIFLSQILSDDHSCDDAVERFQKFRYDQGLPAVAPETSSYCEARQRLPEGLTWELVRRTGQAIQDQAKDAWLFHGRSVKIIDGSTVTMPDTPENQAAYPQLESQAPGIGFPIARLLVVFSLAVGTVLEATLGPYQGKQTSELALLRQILDQFQPGDIVLADRFFSSYWTIAALQARGVDIVVRLHQARQADFRRGRRLGREDHLVTWTKPQHVPDWMSRAEYEAMPAQITVRELRIRVRDRTKRVRDLVIVTTLVDRATYPAVELGSLFRQRWHAELDLRTLKTEMQMEQLRTQSPAMVRKEVAIHLLAYNLIRGIMAEAARVVEVKPRRLSFTGALHTVRSFEESHLYDPTRIAADLPRLLELIGQKRVGNRPDRYEPRAVKRRSKPYPRLKIPRRAAKRLIKRGIRLYEKA
ncbi:MAG: IS4 family transposase [Planctomycetaceae bacterium]|nr:IS4 family transposase [Planctomycetaceae bacterium]MBV8608572.1 IS4 family transposase [Singulisphaera sp.]